MWFFISALRRSYGAHDRRRNLRRERTGASFVDGTVSATNSAPRPDHRMIVRQLQHNERAAFSRDGRASLQRLTAFYSYCLFRRAAWIPNAISRGG
jgi:hypothetical protein